MATLNLVCDLDPVNRELLDALNAQDDHSITLALTRRGLFHLLDQEIPFTTPMTYISAKRAQELAEMAAGTLDAAISLAEGRRDGLAFNPVRPLAYRLLHYFSYGMFVIELLESASDQAPNGVSCVRILGSNGVVDAGFGVPDVLGLIVAIWCSERSGNVVRIGGTRADRGTMAFTESIGKTWARTLGLAKARHFAGSVRNGLRGFGALLALGLHSLFRHKRIIFIEASRFDLQAVMNSRPRPSGVRWIDLAAALDGLNGLAGASRSIAKGYQAELKAWWDEQIAETRFAGLFSHRGISLVPAVRQYCEKLVTDDLDRGLMSFGQAQSIFSRTARAAGLVSLGRGAGARFAWIAEAASSAGIPCFGVAHGGTVGLVDMPRQRLIYRDLSVMIHYGSACLLPKGVVSKNVGLGSPRLGRLSQAMKIGTAPPHDPRTIVWCWHPARELAVDGWMAAWDRLVIPRLELLDLFVDTNFRVIVRPFPGGLDDATVGYGQSKCRGLYFERHRPFSEIMAEADVLILEHPSTPLIEALCTTKPILFFAASDIFHYQPGALELLRRRCAVFETAEEYVEGVRQFLKDPQSVLKTTDVRDTAFQQAYARPVSEAEFCNGLTRVVLEELR